MCTTTEKLYGLEIITFVILFLAEAQLEYVKNYRRLAPGQT